MPPSRQRATADAADALSRVAPPVSRWMERLLATHEPALSLTQYLTLQAIAAGDAGGAQLAREAAVSAAAVSQLLGALQQAGLVDRGAVQGDRRRQMLSLTPAGSSALQSAQALLSGQLAQLLGDVPVPELHALARSLHHLEALLAGKPPPPRPPRPAPPRHGPHAR